MAQFRVFRFDPEKDAKPYFQNYNLPDIKGLTVLEGLYYILENLDPSLAFRSSCREAVCGSCAMHINGQYRLACETQVDDFHPHDVVVRPLAHMEIERDLVVDMRPFYKNLELIKPYLIPKDKPGEKEYIQSVEERQKLNVVTDCILCGACYGSCPVAATDDRYLGPAALLKALRFVNDSRDGATAERLAYVATDVGVFRCHTIFNCQQVCPKDLDPTGAIAKLKRKSIWYKLTGRLGRAKREVA